VEGRSGVEWGRRYGMGMDMWVGRGNGDGDGETYGGLMELGICREGLLEEM